MGTRGQRPTWWMGGVAAAGVLATHWLTYRLAIPHADHRAEVLHHTGHEHWPVVSAVGLALFTAASLRLCLHGLRGGRVAGLRPMAMRLAAGQALAWTVLEVGERAVAGRLGTWDDHGVLLLGLAVQVTVAVAGAVLVRLAVRVLSTLAARAVRPWPRPRSAPSPARSSRPFRLAPLTGAHALRGPPLASPPMS